MAIEVGERIVQAETAARSSTANATAADIEYPVAVLNDNPTDYMWANDKDLTVADAGKYLTIYDIGQVSNASTRAVGTLVPNVNSTNQSQFRATHRYLRNAGGQMGASFGLAVLDLSASDVLKIRNPGAITPTDSLGNYATRVDYGGAIQVVRLPDIAMTHVERTVDAAECGVTNANTTRPWVDSTGTWTKITYDSEVLDEGSLYPGSGGDVTLAANKKYLIVWGSAIWSTNTGRKTFVTALNIGGTRRQTGSAYQRNGGSQGPPACGMYLHETGGAAETLYLEATEEAETGGAGTPQVDVAYLQVIELPATAEWLHVDNGATDTLDGPGDLAGTGTYYDTPLSSTVRADGNSDLSLDAANDAVQNDSGGSLPVLAIGWHRWDRDNGSSGTRKMPWSRWDNGGTTVGYGVAGAYSRGAQGSTDTWQAHYCSAALLDLANAADLKFQVNDPGSALNAEMGIFASTNRHFLGVQVLNLASLSGAPPPTPDPVVRAGVLISAT